MAELIVVTRDGCEHSVTAEPDFSVMEAIRNAGIDEVVALCGGCCSCATCHVYIDDEKAMLPPISEDESDLLDSSEFRTERSRLSCQINCTVVPPGTRIEVAPEG